MTPIHSIRLLAVGVLFCVSPAHAQFCENSAGQIASFLIDGARVTVIDESFLSVIRGGDSVDVVNGMPLCPGDVITVEADASAIVHLSEEGEDASELTLIGRSELEIDSPTSVLARVGRMFVKLRGKFDIRFGDGSTLGARGTQFEVQVADHVDVLQLEGRVEFQRLGGPVPERRTVEPLQQLAIELGGSSVAETEALSPDACAEVTKINSRIVAAAQPALPFDAQVRSFDPANRATDFADDRTKVLCLGDTAARAGLAVAYADWAMPSAVLSPSPRMPDGLPTRDQAMYATSVADAYRQTGELNQALRWYARAMNIDPGFAPPHSGTGDAYRDLAIVAFDPENTSTTRAVLGHLDRAEGAYRKSLDPGLDGMSDAGSRSAVVVKLGNLALIRAAFDPDSSTRFVSIAIRYFEQALELTSGDAPFAEIGLARVDALRAALIPDVRIEGDLSFGEMILMQAVASKSVESQREPHYKAARDRLRKLLDRYPDFSAASLELGDVFDQLRDRERAEEVFRDAIRFDPANVAAYFRLADTLIGDDNRKERRYYRSAYRATVSPGYDKIIRLRPNLREPATVEAVVMDVRALLPSPSTVTFEYGEPLKKIVTFTNPGSEDVTVSESTTRGDRGFSVTDDKCIGQTLGPNDKCTLQIELSGEPDDYAGTLIIKTDAGPETKIKLAGTIEQGRIVQ